MTIQHVKYTATVDGGYAGKLTISMSKPPGQTAMFFIESDLVDAKLILTPEHTEALGEALLAASEEALPPKPWALQAFPVTFRRPVPRMHSKTAADLKRHVRALSDKHEQQRAKRLKVTS
jgi:hypothetical protein